MEKGLPREAGCVLSWKPVSQETDMIVNGLRGLTIYVDGEGMIEGSTHEVIIATIMHLEVQEGTIAALRKATASVSKGRHERRLRLPWRKE